MVKLKLCYASTGKVRYAELHPHVWFRLVCGPLSCEVCKPGQSTGTLRDHWPRDHAAECRADHALRKFHGHHRDLDGSESLLQGGEARGERSPTPSKIIRPSSQHVNRVEVQWSTVAIINSTKEKTFRIHSNNWISRKQVYTIYIHISICDNTYFTNLQSSL